MSVRLTGRVIALLATVAAAAVVLIVLLPRVKLASTSPADSSAATTSAGQGTPTGDATPVVPTSEELIASALKAGTITYEESLIQRAFAWLNDRRLEREFRSPIVDWEAGGVLLDEIHRKEAMLSQAALSVLAPFRARPSDPKSVFNQPRTDAVKSQYGAGSVYWTSMLVSGGAGWTPLRVWIKGGQPELLRYMADIKSMWASYHKFFVDPWKDDGDPELEFNPDEAVDMYLVHVGETDPRCASTPCSVASVSNGGWTTIALPDNGPQCAAYVIINLDQRRDELIGAMAHELTHTGQRTYDCADPHLFLNEGSATWVGYTVLKDLGITPQYGYDYLKNPRRYSFFPNLSRSLDRGANAYASWPFYYYASMEFGNDVVKLIWRNHVVGSGVTGADTVNKVVRFDEHFPKFAIRNWNQDATPIKYKDGDRTFPGLTPDPIRLMPTDPSQVELDEPVPSLAAQYYYYSAFDQSVRRITFENLYHGLPGAHVWALKKVGNSWQTPEDWTRDEKRMLCRDIPTENVSELVLIVSNSDLDNPLPPAHPKPRVRTEDVGCVTLEGWAKATLRVNNPGTNMTYVASLTTVQFRPRSVQNPDTGNTEYDLLPTSVVWTANGTEGDCRMTGSTVINFPMYVDQPLDPTRLVYGYMNVVPAFGGDFHSITIHGIDRQSRMTRTCPGSPPRVVVGPYRSALLLHILSQSNTHIGKRVSYKGQQTYDPERFQDNLPPAALEMLKGLPNTSGLLNRRGGEVVYTFEWELNPRQSGP
jgi:hypothetical protein